MLEDPTLDRFIESDGKSFNSLCVTLKAALLRPNKEWIRWVMVVVSCLDLAAGPVVSLLSKVSVFCPSKHIFFAYSVTVTMSSAAEGICTVMVVVDKIAFGPGEFEVGAVLT